MQVTLQHRDDGGRTGSWSRAPLTLGPWPGYNVLCAPPRLARHLTFERACSEPTGQPILAGTTGWQGAA